MAGVARKHLVDGRETTVAEVAAELGVTAAQIYSQMKYRGVSLQVVANMIRSGLVLDGQGRAARHWVDGRWMTTKQAAEMLGVTPTALTQWRFRYKRPDGTPALLSDAVQAYREGRVARGGREPRPHKVRGRTMTVAEAAAQMGVTPNALRLYMSRHRVTLETAVKARERRKRRQAERDILKILGY